MLASSQFLAAPLLACVAIAGLHAYLGIHVIRREIIFVDLALAQIAALGTLTGLLVGVPAESPLSLLSSFAFVLLAAWLFATTRQGEQTIPQEAVIGITYGVATAAAILVADRVDGGAQYVKEMLTGVLLWVSWPEALRLVAAYLAIAAFYFVFRRRFILLTDDYARALAAGIRGRLWDFLFYIPFGIAILMAVRLAGILLVFSFLVVPAAISALFSERWGASLALGWSLGSVVSVLGLSGSYLYDIPAGPAIVLLLGLLLVVGAAAQGLRKQPAQKPMAAKGG